MKVRQMTNGRGLPVKNQFLLYTNEGVYFQSYETVIALKKNDGSVLLDRNNWDYSKTTGKYRNEFLGETKKETEKKIASGVYTLANLNSKEGE